MCPLYHGCHAPFMWLHGLSSGMCFKSPKLSYPIFQKKKKVWVTCNNILFFSFFFCLSLFYPSLSFFIPPITILLTSAASRSFVSCLVRKTWRSRPGILARPRENCSKSPNRPVQSRPSLVSEKDKIWPSVWYFHFQSCTIYRRTN